MNQSHLTLKYRPQVFAEVLGQDAVCRILSRAAAESAVAPAYLFSGTRGVGKTTLARILAKAINCARGPAAEPCNQCDNCLQITRGSSVDVVEIDGASNTGVEHVRRLKEDVGYAPIEYRYKVIIIDEAHMLSKAAFNALLKTLEEPPAHVAFIMATTEAQRFPATIVSRCQHYVFKRLSQQQLEEHLAGILEKEGVTFDPAAVTLLARRGAGSVRDSLSLMSQVMALGADSLAEEDVRQVLGLTGHETLFELFEALSSKDCRAISGLLQRILDQGLDLGFFLRELTMAWRNLFLLRQTDGQGLDLIQASDADAERWVEWSRRFPLAQVHASWQLTLEGQRRVLTSVEPALALELLLLNLAFLSDLLPVEALSPGGTPSQSGGREGPEGPHPSGPAPVRSGTAGRGANSAEGSGTHDAPQQSSPVHPVSQESVPQQSGPDRTADGADWPGFVRFCEVTCREAGRPLPLKQVTGQLDGAVLKLVCTSRVQCERLKEREKFDQLCRLAAEYFGSGVSVEVTAGAATARPNVAEVKSRAHDHPVVQEARKVLNAQVIDVRPVDPR
ncbi:MAG: DNA polymerase III subunit gamma/tau [Desulfohalobiaceae bacterium]